MILENGIYVNHISSIEILGNEALLDIIVWGMTSDDFGDVQIFRSDAHTFMVLVSSRYIDNLYKNKKHICQ